MIAPTHEAKPSAADLAAELAGTLKRLGSLQDRLRHELRSGPRDRRLELLFNRVTQLGTASEQLVDRVAEPSTPEAVRESQNRKGGREAGR